MCCHCIFLTELLEANLQALPPFFVIMYAYTLLLESCIVFSSILLAVPALVMEHYTQEAPERKRSWDQRPTLPRRRPLRTEAFTLAADGQPVTRRPLPRPRRRDPLPRLKNLNA